MTAQVDVPRLDADAPEVPRLQRASVAAGLAAFALLYTTQAVLPLIADTFDIGASAASLTVSVATGALALAVLPMSTLAERLGRVRVMSISLCVACACAVAAAGAPTFALLLAVRALDGVALAGVMAVVAGHVGDEVEPTDATKIIGWYISATAVGGLLGRLIPAAVVGAFGWRWAVAAVAAAGVLMTIVFVRLVPPGRRAEVREPGTTRMHLRDRGIVRLCFVAFLLMGGFVATYNYLTFRLHEAPFALPAGVVGALFVAYLAGTVSSATAARLALPHGRRRTMLCSILIALAGIAATLSSNLPLIIAGLLVFTAGFFGAHGIASGWVPLRAPAHKSQASALYVMAYYLGSSVLGTVIGFAWTGSGWPATVACVAGCFVLAAVAAAGIRSHQ